MADKTSIEWTDATWQIVTGCSVVSPGCTNCYAMKLAGTRLQHHPSRSGLTTKTKAGPVWNGLIRYNEQWLRQPLEWRKPRDIFVAAHGDLFHDGVERWMLVRIFAVMACATWHRFQVLTKRAENMRNFCRWLETTEGRAELEDAIRQLGRVPMAGGRRVPITLPLPNVWLGVSAEDQPRADERIPLLLDTPAAVRWMSAEPLLGALNLHPYLLGFPAGHPASCACGHGHGFDRCPNYGKVAQRCHRCDCQQFRKAPGSDGLHWVVAGGESGPGARPAHPDWFRSLRDQCAVAGVPYFHKQNGAWVEWSPELPDGSIVSHVFRGAHAGKDVCMTRIGKKAAGAKLDGREHREFPR